MFHDIKFADAEKNHDFLFIDVRSPKEFQEATIPGAINIPLFDNDERAKVGTIYKQEGQNKAVDLGVEIVSPKIPQFINKIKANLQSNQKPVFFCWRGGMRSKAMATFFSLVNKGYVYRLEGGYRAYRGYILKKINDTEIQIPTFILHGMTGVGKTILLYKLFDLGVNVLDLEGFAGHRGSIFGGIGHVSPKNQKTFDSKIYHFLRNINDQTEMVIEAESKRIGKVMVPENILTAKENGYHILIEASVEKRIERIISEYEPEKYKDSINDALTRLEMRLPTDIRTNLFTALAKDDYDTIVELLLKYYYDPRYQHSTDQYTGPFFTVNSDDLDYAAQQIATYIQKVLTNNLVNV